MESEEQDQMCLHIVDAVGPRSESMLSKQCTVSFDVDRSIDGADYV
jgi:hypothetical protein